MALKTTVNVTGYKVELEITDGTGGVPTEPVDAGIYWDPAILGVKSLIDTDFDLYSSAKGVIMWCKIDAPTKNVFQIELERLNPGATHVHGTGVACETGARATDMKKLT